MATVTQMFVIELTGPSIKFSTPGDLSPAQTLVYLQRNCRDYEFYMGRTGRVCYRTSAVVDVEKHEI